MNLSEAKTVIYQNREGWSTLATMYSQSDLSTYQDLDDHRRILARWVDHLVGRQRRSHSPARQRLIDAGRKIYDHMVARMLWLECN